MNKNIGYIVKYFLINRCNFECDYCCVKIRRHKDILYTPSKEDMNNLISNIKLLNIKMFELYGGEPTLNENLCWFIEESHKRLKVNTYKLFTNGSGDISTYQNILALKEKYNLNIEIILSFHPKYGLKYLNNYNIIGTLFPDTTKLKILLDLRYKENINTFLKTDITISNKTLCIMESTSNETNASFNYEKNLYESSYHNIDELLEFIKPYGYTEYDIKQYFINPFYEKICYANNIVIDATGYINYDSCFKNTNKHNIYKNVFYSKMLKKKCDKFYVLNVPKCLQHFHDDNDDIQLSELDFGMKI